MNSRRLSATTFGLLVLTAALVGAVVIPAVRADSFPAGTPDRAIRALWIIVAGNLILGAFALTLGRATAAFPSLVWRLAACSIALPALLMALALLDGGFAYLDHGAVMRPAAVAMLLGAAANSGAAVLTVTMGLGRHTDRSG